MMDKKIYISLLAAFSLAGCTNGNMWENLTGSRSPEAVQGMRRVPELNTQNRIAPINPTSPPVAGATYATPSASSSPFDSYDESGNPIAGKPQIVEKPQSANVPALRKSFPGNTAAEATSTANQPAIQEKRPIDTLKTDTSKDLHTSTSSKNEASVYSAPKPVEKVAEPKPVVSSTGGKGLASVPEKPSQFEDARKSYNDTVTDLKESHNEANKYKEELDAEIANPEAVSTSTTPATNTSSPSGSTSTTDAQDIIKPIAPPVADSTATGSAPAKDAKDTATNTIIPSYSSSDAQDSAGAIPVSSLPEIKVDSTTDTALPEAPKPQEQNVQKLSNLPDPETIKLLPPSRYSARVQANQNPHH